jgi:HAMP domain-containing protein
MRFFQSSSLLYVALGIIFLFFAWQWSENRLSRMPIEIIRESNQKPEHTPTNTTPLMKQQMTARFGYFNAITSIFAVVFVILVWVQLAVAGMNSERVVHVFWNEFGEYHIEVILFVLIGILIIINTVWSIKRLRA